MITQTGNKYHINECGESLTARLVEDDSRKVELNYRSVGGDRTRLTIEAGAKTSIEGYCANGIILDHGTPGFMTGLDRLGPKLREQIPVEWHKVLGKWLAPKSE